MNNLLITGSQGQLGSELARLEKIFPNLTFFFTDRRSLDITNFEDVEKFVSENNITVIINCAAYTNVDEAENEPISANKINHLSVKNLAEIAKKYAIKLIHISTDYVFDGTSKTPYLENSETNPQNEYGNSKLKGELAIKEVNPVNSIIIRTSWLYSNYRINFVKKILKLSKEKESISVVSDQIGSPTNARDLAKTILQIVPLIDCGDVQLYHYSNKGNSSWFEFAQEIVLISKMKCSVKPILSKDFKTKAYRPTFSKLNTAKIEEEFNILIPTWQDSLKGCIKKLNKN